MRRVAWSRGGVFNASFPSVLNYTQMSNDGLPKLGYFGDVHRSLRLETLLAPVSGKLLGKYSHLGSPAMGSQCGRAGPSFQLIRTMISSGLYPASHAPPGLGDTQGAQRRSGNTGASQRMESLRNGVLEMAAEHDSKSQEKPRLAGLQSTLCASRDVFFTPETASYFGGDAVDRSC